MIPDLAKLHTRQLLTLLADARAFGPAGHVYRNLPDKIRRANRTWDHTGHADDFLGKPCPGTECFTIAELKAELAKRPHVPNKVEARKIRQEKARR
jgi:hypothetical protein